MSLQALDVPAMDAKLRELYGEDAAALSAAILELIRRYRSETLECEGQRWSQRDVVLITYGDQVQPVAHASDANRESKLQTLFRFLDRNGLFDRLNTVHFLPCFPYSSDDGFSVIDYREIDPDLGTWEDVHRFRDRGAVMLDFVVNHISQHSAWFQGYLRGETKYESFFIEADPQDPRLQEVTRPRSLPLLTPFETSTGEKHLWTTFSDDQIDLNYAEPALLVEVLDILLEYIKHGARIIRLDAIAYLWKRLGTSCIHLRETHLVVKLMRSVLEQVAPQVLLLSETNVPHSENVSYFGDGDEAHMVYQFSLPPLLLDAFLNEDAQPFKSWLSTLEPPPPGATYFNFTASHDGVGVRPLEGLVDDTRLHRLVEKIKARGGLVSTRRNADGTDSPYELNIAYVDALAPETGESDDEYQVHAARFLATQAVMMSLQGMPAVYFHSLVGTQNDLAGVAASGGMSRRINRRKYRIDELEQALATKPLQGRIFAGMQRLLDVRIEQAAFHPDVEQRYIETGDSRLVAFERRAASQSILVVVNFGTAEADFLVPDEYAEATDLLGGLTGRSPDDAADQIHETQSASRRTLQLQPAQAAWLSK